MNFIQVNITNTINDMRYFSEIETSITSKELIELSMQQSNLTIDEGLFSGLKGLFGKYLEGVGKIFSASSKALGAEKGKKWEAFHNEIMGNKSDMKKAINEKDPQKAIDAINSMADKYKSQNKLDDSTINSFKICLALEFNTQHNDDENYKKAMTKFIDECKKAGGSETEKDVSNLAGALKNDGDKGEGEGEGSTGTSPEDAKQDDSQINKGSKMLSGNAKKVKVVTKAMLPESLEEDEEDINEAEEGATKKKSSSAVPDWVKSNFGDFRSKYLLLKDKNTREQNRTNRNCFINLINAVSSFMENVKGPESKEKWEFVQKFLSTKEVMDALS